MTRNREGTFKGANGLELYYQSWHPQATARAVCAIVHGHGGHSGILTTIVEYLTEHNYCVYSFDLRGHGRSPGQRGHINSWTEYREDLKTFLHFVTAREPELPLFLIGQSMGGTISLDYTLHEPDRLKGLILMSPALGLGVSPIKLGIGKLLSRILPQFSLDTGVDPATGSRNPEVVAAYTTDPLRHSQGTARLATELLATISSVKAHAADIRVPILILHGGADCVTPPESSRTFFENLTIKDKKIIEYPDSYHELHNDLDYQQVLADLGDWLNRHL